MQQEAVREYCGRRGIAIIGYAPLGTSGGGVGGKPRVLDDPVLNEVAVEVGKDAAAVALRFLLQICPHASVIPKSGTPERLKSNLELSFTLTDDQIERLKSREKCYRYCDGSDWGFDPFGDAW
jgi:diketogulonate reductase-like aldo/keto reductase